MNDKLFQWFGVALVCAFGFWIVAAIYRTDERLHQENLAACRLEFHATRTLSDSIGVVDRKPECRELLIEVKP